MDDLTFRKRIYANPNDNKQAIIDACKNDVNKAKFKSDMQTFDAKLRDALHIKAPENFADKILLSQTFESQNGKIKRHRVHLALAASVALFIGVFSYKLALFSDFGTVAEYALEHHNHELNHQFDNVSYDLKQVNDKLANFGGEIVTNLSNISFANFCYFGRIKSLHMVFQGENYPVTVFLIPKNSGLQQSAHFSDHQFIGESIDIDNTQLLIITNKDDPNKNWADTITQSIKWKTA